VLFIVIGVALTLMLLFVSGIVLFLLYRHNPAGPGTAPASVKITANLPVPENYSLSNSITVFLGERSTKNYSSSNQISVLLAEDEPGTGGLQHLINAGGGHASIQNLDGVPCCYLNRINENRMYASLYFAIDPSFKRERLKNARVEIEYLAKRDTAFRLQFDGLDGDTHRMYKPVLPEGARVMRFGTGADYGTIPLPASGAPPPST